MNEKLLDIKKDGVEMVTYPEDLRHSVEHAAKLWKEFCSLPPEIKQHFTAENTQNGVGYESKNGEGPHGDTKENFDFSIRDLDALLRAVETTDSKIAADFINAVQTLSEHAIPMIEQFGKRLELEHDVDGFAEIAKRSAPEAFYRFLHYPSGQAPGGTIAEPHDDHGGFTFHYLETTDGCERLTLDTRQWQPLPVAEGEAAAFAGMQTQLVSGGEIKALSHRVLANETSSQVGRFAIVCFVALKDVPMYDKRTHGRLQEFTPGFNYDLPPEEFAKLFVKK